MIFEVTEKRHWQSSGNYPAASGLLLFLVWQFIVLPQWAFIGSLVILAWLLLALIKIKKDDLTRVKSRCQGSGARA